MNRFRCAFVVALSIPLFCGSAVEAQPALPVETHGVGRAAACSALLTPANRVPLLNKAVEILNLQPGFHLQPYQVELVSDANRFLGCLGITASGNLGLRAFVYNHEPVVYIDGQQAETKLAIEYYPARGSAAAHLPFKFATIIGGQTVYFNRLENRESAGLLIEAALLRKFANQIPGAAVDLEVIRLRIEHATQGR